MKDYKLKIVAVAICVTVAVIAMPNRKQAGQAAKLQPPKSDLKKLLTEHSGNPLTADLDQASVESTGEREKRNGRDRVSEGLYTHKVILDPGMKEINGDGESIDLTFIDTVQILKPGQIEDPPGLPISGAMILIGKVMDGDAYLNDQHTGVFSEYSVAVSEVLSSDPKNPVSVGDNISTWRPGGSVSFRSGHTKHFIVAGRGFPEIGVVYLFFLRPTDSSLADYAISAAYSMKDQVVSPLDDGRDESAFDGASKTSFLNTVRKEIATREGRRKQ